MFTSMKLYAILAIFIAATSLVLYLKFVWYDELENTIDALEKQLDVTGAELNKCYINGRKNSVESFIEGVGHVDENISIDLDSLHT